MVDQVGIEPTVAQGPLVLQTREHPFAHLIHWSGDTDSNRAFRLYESQMVSLTHRIGVDNGSRTRPGSFTESSATATLYPP
jgi:hypothetical protein